MNALQFHWVIPRVSGADILFSSALRTPWDFLPREFECSLKFWWKCRLGWCGTTPKGDKLSYSGQVPKTRWQFKLPLWWRHVSVSPVVVQESENFHSQIFNLFLAQVLANPFVNTGKLRYLQSQFNEISKRSALWGHGVGAPLSHNATKRVVSFTLRPPSSPATHNSVTWISRMHLFCTVHEIVCSYTSNVFQQVWPSLGCTRII